MCGSIPKHDVYWQTCVLHSFDQVMVSATDDISDRDDWMVFRREMEAQFYFHCGTAILKKASEVSFEDLIWSYITVNLRIV